MFELEKAIAQWRTDACAHMTDEHLEELEMHLRDAVEYGMDAGFNKEDAFVLAAHRLGESDAIGKELAIEAGLMPPKPVKPVKRLRWWKAFTVAAVACLIALLGAEWLHWYHHESYSAKAVAELHATTVAKDLPIFERQAEMFTSDPIDMATEIEVMVSDKTLADTVAKLKLDEQWEITYTQAIKRVRRGLSTNRLGESQLVEIVYKDSDLHTTREIPNAVIKSYRDRRREAKARRHMEALHTLQKQLKDKADQVEEARLKALDLAERYRITPGEEALAAQREADVSNALREVEIRVAISGERDEESEAIKQLTELRESTRDSVMDLRRKTAEYQEAMGEWELQTSMLVAMQRAFAEGTIVATMPFTPATVHQISMVPVRRDNPDWPLIFARTAGNGWGWILFAGLLGIFTTRSWTRWRQGRDLNTSQGGKVDADEEISWA